MLYINTKNKRQTYTAYQALILEAEEGVIVPLRLPFFSKKELSDIYCFGFSGIIAFILNKFFSKGVTATQIDQSFAVAVPSADLLDRKTLLVCFDGKFQDLERSILNLLVEDKLEASVWTQCAVRISLLFAISAELMRCGIRCADYAVVSSDPLSFVPVFYGKLMGLPVNKIIISAANEDSIWNYLHKCEEVSDVVYEYFTHGLKHNDEIVSDLSSFVVSDVRAKEIIFSVQSTYKKSISMTAASSYGALQDYRAITGENNTTVIFNN